MSEVIPANLAARWYDYWRRFSGSREERKALAEGQPIDVVAAHGWVADQIEAGGVLAVKVLSDLVEAAPEGNDGVTVGVGALEELLYTHGDKIVDVLLEQVRRTPALARALGHVSLADESISASSLAKLRQYSAR